MGGSFVVVRWVDTRALKRHSIDRTGQVLWTRRWVACPAHDERAPRVVAGVGGRRGRKRRWRTPFRLVFAPDPVAASTPIGRRERRRLQRHVRRERDRLVCLARFCTNMGACFHRDPLWRAVATDDARTCVRRKFMVGDGERALLAWLDGGRPQGAVQARAWLKAERQAHMLAAMAGAKHASVYGGSVGGVL